MIERFASGRAVVVLLGATLGMLLLFARAEDSVYPHVDGVSGMPTIVELQLAFDEPGFKRVWEIWSFEPCAADLTVSAICHVPPDVEPISDGPAAWKRNTARIDFVFPVVYAAFFATALGWVWRMSTVGVRRLTLIGAGVVIADWIENGIHLSVLKGLDTYEAVAAADLNDGAIAVASWFAAGKWAAIGAGVLGLVAGMTARLSSAVTQRGRRAS